MKRRFVRIALVVLGIFGILQYVYIQFTPLALNYGGVVTESMYGTTVITEVVMVRDWSLGIIGALIGVVMLSLGVWCFKGHCHD